PIYSVRLSQTDYGIQAQVVPVIRGNKPTKRVSPDSLQGRQIVYKANSVDAATEWIFAGLRCAQVCNSFELHNVTMSKHFLTQLKETAPTFNVSDPATDALRTHTRGRTVLRVFGFLDLWIVGFPDDVPPARLIGAFLGLSDVRTKSARLQWKHIDDALLRCYAEKRFWKSFPRATKGVDEHPNSSVRDLKLRKPRVTKEFVANLVKAHQSCDHNDPIRLELAEISKQSAAEDTWLIERGLE
ncbi:hypothetical protein AAVH_19856, partial [Aphelenchoides avenae]